ncbi:MAG: hypothetical protein ACE5H8_06865 [Alphaproteobacteria bacterium]
MRGMLVLCMCCAHLALASMFGVHGAAAEEPPKDQSDTAVDRYMELGTPEGELGGEEQKAFERRDIKTQIKTFIPPLLRPAFTQHAFVLPPGLFSASISDRFVSLDGDDFFKNGDPNRAVFNDFEVDRNLTDFDVFYGFDLDRKYLHGFTLRINVPYKNSQTDGFIHPNGQQFISIENAGSTQSIGDIGIFLKKKVWDQGTRPFGLAVVGGVFLPTGSNNEKFGSNGRVTTKRPQPPDATAAQGFDAVQAANVANGTWGDGKCFFRNFNQANRALCDGAAAGIGGAFGVPAAGPLSFAPGGANFNNAFVGDFPFNNGIFGRFSPDGRLPSVLQPGTGDFSYLVAGFLTRQFSAGDLVGRSAVHLGVAHRFVFEEDGIDFGDTTTFFASFVKPVYKDFLALDLTFVGSHHEDDSYSGKIPEPEIHTCDATDVATGVGGCAAVGDDAFVFELVDRPSFSGGFTGFVAPSLIFSPDPQIRMTLTGLVRVIEPDLGPAPPWVVRAGLEVIF